MPNLAVRGNKGLDIPLVHAPKGLGQPSVGGSPDLSAGRALERATGKHNDEADCERNCRKHHNVHALPANRAEQFAGHERAKRDEAKNQKVVEGLNFAALRWPVTVRHNGRRTDEAEIPTDSEQDHRQRELTERNTR